MMNKILQIFKKLVRSKNLKYSTIMVIMICVATAIALVVNMLVGMANLKWDLTSNKMYSIGDTTKEILEGLEKDVIIYGLFDEEKLSAGDIYKDVVYLLEQYDRYPRITVKYVDIERNPGFVNEIDPDKLLELSSGEFVVQSGNKKKKLEYLDLFATQWDQNSFRTVLTGSDAEQGFTGAIKYVTADVTPTIYYTQGHGEPEMGSEYEYIKNTLERNNFDVKPLDLLIEETVPEDSTVLLVISPAKDITVEERDKLEQYLKRDGGRAMFFFDPPASGNVSYNEFNKLFSEFNVAINNDTIRENDKSMHLANSQHMLVPNIKSTSINYNLGPDTFKMLVPGARSVEILKNVKEYIEVTSLVSTSDEAESLSTESEDKNKTGEFDLAVAVEYTGGFKPSKLLVMGNSTFMSDALYERYGSNTGMYFFVNSLLWMYDQKDDVYIAPKMYQSQTISVTAMQRNVFMILLVVVLPLLVLGMGAFVYLRRRHL
jgi:ABC-2 type transport system permease protein